MPDHEAELAEVYLQPGEMYLAREPTMIRTLLGSCVGVAFWSKKLGIGALCHAMLPKCPDGYSLGVNPEVGYRYVDFCIRDLARKFDGLGAHRTEVEAKLFGGADVLLGSDDAPVAPCTARRHRQLTCSRPRVLTGEPHRTHHTTISVPDYTPPSKSKNTSRRRTAPVRSNMAALVSASRLSASTQYREPSARVISILCGPE